MSISYSTDLVCGFKVKIDTVRIKKTKYNQETGEPYEQDVPSHEIATVDGIEIGSTANNPDAFCQGEKIDSLEFGESGYEQGQRWIGYIVTSVTGDIDFATFETEEPERVTSFAAKHGLTPKWFVSMSCG